MLLFQHAGLFSRLSLLGLAALLIPLTGWADTASDVRDFTGAPTRMVWLQDAGPTASVYSEHPTLRLMGFDTEDGKGERPILPDIGWYGKPVLTADGNRVVFANIANHTVEVVNFDGTGRRVVLKNDEAYQNDGRPFLNNAVWTDPISGITWVYAQVMEQRAGQSVPSIRRFQLDHPEVSELIWDKTPAYMFMLSGDGRVASGGPVDGGNSAQGIFTLPNGTFLAHHNGCWPSMSPDASHRMWVFQGNHQGILLCTPVGKSGAVTTLGFMFAAPGDPFAPGVESYHPRWTNNVHFLAMDGPFPHQAWNFKSDVKIPQDVAANVQIYLGKFNDDFTGIVRWIQVTHSTGGNYWSNVWIKPSQADIDALIAASKAPQDTILAPPSPKGLVYTWLNGGAGNQIADPATGALRQCSGQLHGNARYGLGYAMDLTNGSFVPDDAAGPLLTACKASNQLAVEADITPSGAISDGEKVIMIFGADPANANFVLGQQGDKLTLRLKTDGAGTSAQPLTLCSLTQNQSNHVIVSYTDGKLACFINGQEALLSSPFHGGFSNWTAQPLIFGDAAQGGHNWPGLMEGINIFSRDVGIAEAKSRYFHESDRSAARKPVETVVMDAKLVTRCSPADPSQIAPYRRCLSVSLYEVEKVISGTCKDPKIAVAQWSVLDAKVDPDYLKFTAGQTYRLAVEKMDDHPEQESERTFNGDFDADSLPLYYAVRAPDTTPTAPAPAPVAAASTFGVTTLVDPPADEMTSKDTVQLGGQGGVVAATVVDGGSNYLQAPEVKFSGGGGQGATGLATLGLASFEIAKVGGGYTSSPDVIISAPDLLGGRQAYAEAQVDPGGSITALTVTNPGSGYLLPPRISFSGGGGSGAAARATLALAEIIITNGGSGYTSPPAITLSGGGGLGAAAQAALQLKTYRFIDPAGNNLFTNAGSMEQDGSTLVFDWASTKPPTGKYGLSNTGTWVLKNGARVVYASTSGHPDWIGRNNNNTGTMTITDHSQLGFSFLANGGVIELGPGAILGQSDYSGAVNTIYNSSGKATIKVIGSTPDEPAVYGFVNPDNTGKRTIESGSGRGDVHAQLIIGSGQDSATFNIIGGSVNVNNYLNSEVNIQPGATLALLTNDNGSTDNNFPREVKVTNTGNMLLAGNLRLQGNGGSFAGIENHGKFTIHGDKAEIEHLPNSTGPLAWYNAFKYPVQILNAAGGVLQGVGTMTFTNSTGNTEGRLMRVYDQGILAPGEAADGPSPETFGQLILNNVSLRLGGFILPYPPRGTPPTAPPPPPVAGPTPKPGTLQIGIAGPPTDPAHFDSLTLTGADDAGALELIAGNGNVLNIVTPAGFTPQGTYRIITATSVVGTFETLQFNGAAQVPYKVNYLPNGIEVVFP